MIEQYTYWSVTINNPDDNDWLITRNPNSKYIREFVYTQEQGEEGTIHIQAWLRLQRNQSMAFVKKLYPRAHIKPLKKDEYNENCHNYAQKDDETTRGNHHITLNDPLPAVDQILYKVLQLAFEDKRKSDWRINKDLERGEMSDILTYTKLNDLHLDYFERKMITEKQGLEKIFISPSYEKIKLKYWREILTRIYTNGLLQTESSGSEILSQTDDETSSHSSQN